MSAPPHNSEPGRDPVGELRAALFERVSRQLMRARERSATLGAELRPTLYLSEALRVANDLYLLGALSVAPTLRWRPQDAEIALAPWKVRVLKDPDSLFPSSRPSDPR
jgi:hypothetical protein